MRRTKPIFHKITALTSEKVRAVRLSTKPPARQKEVQGALLAECFDAGLVNPKVVFVDSTHVKARANNHNYHGEAAKEEALWYSRELTEEIEKDRAAHGKRPLKDMDESGDDGNNSEPPASGKAGKPNPNTSRKKQARRKKEKHVKVSNSDPESGWFRKGEHKSVFAHSVQTACDENGVILGYSVHPGNENDGKTFPAVMEKLEALPVELAAADSAYKTPAIARYLSGKGIQLLSAYKRPQTKDGFFRKYEYVYDEYQTVKEPAKAPAREQRGRVEGGKKPPSRAVKTVF